MEGIEDEGHAGAGVDGEVVDKGEEPLVVLDREAGADGVRKRITGDGEALDRGGLVVPRHTGVDLDLVRAVEAHPVEQRRMVRQFVDATTHNIGIR